MAADRVSKWKSKGQGSEITLPSGEKVKIAIPDLAEFLRAGKVPNKLVKFATSASEAQSPFGTSDLSKEDIVDATDFARWLVSATVVEPKIEPDDVPELPALDTDMVIEFAMRQRDVDAVGHQLHGLEVVPEWQKFRYERYGT